MSLLNAQVTDRAFDPLDRLHGRVQLVARRLVDEPHIGLFARTAPTLVGSIGGLQGRFGHSMSSNAEDLFGLSQRFFLASIVEADEAMVGARAARGHDDGLIFRDRRGHGEISRYWNSVQAMDL